jgi:hypothetical protein
MWRLEICARSSLRNLCFERFSNHLSACSEHAANEGNLKSFTFHLQIPDYCYGSNTQFFSAVQNDLRGNRIFAFRCFNDVFAKTRNAFIGDRRSVDRGG